MTKRDLLLSISLLYEGEWDKMYNHIKNHMDPPYNSEETGIRAKKFAEKFKRVDFIDITDPCYPQCFKDMGEKPPLFFYYIGNIHLLDNSHKRLAVIGSRNASDYGKAETARLVKELNNDVVIVSGLAKGIDSIGMKAALETNKKVIAILGSSINHCYPEENKDLYEKIISSGGLIISEYPPNSILHADNFRFRNRLIAAACHGLFIGEAYLKSGTKITANYALKQGKNIGCLPYLAYQKSYCNILIRDGANLILDVHDLENLLN